MRFILTILLGLLFFGAFSQSPSSPLSNNINKRFLEHLVKKGIDEIRKSKGLKKLANDAILYNAACYHSEYLMKIKKLSHTENVDSMKTPQLRAEQYGAVNYGVGENILYIPFGGEVQPKKGKPYSIFTYKDAAKAMVQGWVNSPPHYKNILTSKYEVTGLAIKVDYDKKRIYAVQKFAKVFFKYKFQEDKSIFPYSDYVTPTPITKHNQLTWNEYSEKYPYKLKPLDKSSNQYINTIKLLEEATGFQRLKIINNYVYLEMDIQADQLLNFLSKGKDGLAIEYINYIPYDCGNEEYYTRPSRRNNKSQLSDTLLFPVYRNDLIKGFKPRRKSASARIKLELKKKEDDDSRNVFQKIIDGYKMPYYPDKFKYRIAKLPKNIDGGYYEMNLVYIKNNQIYRVQHFTGICGEFYQEFNELEYASDFGEVEYIPIATKRNLNFDFHFKKGVTQYNYNDLKPALDSLTDDEFIITSAAVDAYSSVEGSEKINKQIQEKRAESIIKALESKQSTKITPTIRTFTNWKLFQEQIKQNEKLKDLRGLDSLDLVQELKNKELTNSIEPFLEKQRIAKVKIETLFDLNEKTLPDFIRKKYIHHQIRMNIKRMTYEEIKSKNENDTESLKELKNEAIKELDTLKSIQLFVFNNIKTGQLDTNFILHMDYKAYDWTACLFLNHFFMEEYFKIPQNRRSFHPNEFKINTQKEAYYAYGAYNYIRNLIKNWDGKKKLPDFKTPEIQSILTEIENEHPHLQDTIRKLKINFWFKAAEYHFLKKEVNLKNEYLTRIFLNYKDKKIEELHALKLAKFFVHFEYYEPARIILQKHLNTTKNEDIIVYIFKLNNYNNIEWQNDSFAKDCIRIKEKLSKESWCGMFMGECNISFQVMDYEPLRTFYCEQCNDYKNKIELQLRE